MKILKSILTGICLLVGITSVSAQGIEFEHNFNTALEKAKKENKMIFVDFYTSWCGPCKAMSADVFPQKEAGDYFNKEFVNVKVQCDDKGEGVELGKKYNVMAYPTLMFLDKDGNTVHSTAGGQSVRGLIELAKIAADPNKNQLSMIKEWDNGNRNPEFMSKYFQNLIRSYRNVKATTDFETYFEGLSAKDKANQSTFELMQIVRVAPFSAPFSYLEDHKKDYYKTIGKKEIDSLLATQYLWYLKGIQSNGMTNKNMDEFDEKMALFKSKKYPYYDEYASFYAVFDSKDANGKDDINLYCERGSEFLRKYGAKNDSYTLSLASMLGNWTGKKGQSLAGIKWMEDLLARNDDPKYYNTYFYITWRNYELDKAMEIAERMKGHALAQNKSTTDADKNIQMIKDLKVKYGY